MEAFLISAGLVALAEIGDKTQLLAIMLAARYRRAVPILLGILVATVANHLLAASVGAVAGSYLKGPWVHWVLGLAFIAFAAWTLVPDKMEEDEQPKERGGGSIFVTTAVAFFFVEMGDKTQIATAALGARFHEIGFVAAGTTLGMMLADGPAVFLGELAATRLPLKLMRTLAAVAFAVLGVWTILAG
ncbi:MAG TPA: TMEM165/GDT1 family protein [Caulobacteraceae bacterium]|nr:TMEM165/GDT1 family protein [Caulobacteraceae bacterium]